MHPIASSPFSAVPGAADSSRIRPLRAAVLSRLLPWFRLHRRALPWRRRRTPYRVWIAELMLQQTRVDQVVPYYERFMRRFPSLRALARASRAEVLKAWEGMGYYARARHMHDAARFIAGPLRGRFPRTPEKLMKLPGIGRYTANAVASLAFAFDAAVLDGNVIRVLARVLAFDRDVTATSAREELQRVADRLIVRGRAGEVNEALMELGAICCLPRNPACDRCPLRGVCRARLAGRPEAYPVKRRRKPVPHKVVGAGVVINRRGEILIAQRKESSMLGGLWEFPGGTRERGESMPECIARELKEELGISTEVGRRLVVVHHAYSHFTIDLHAHWARIVKGRPRAIHCADFAWTTIRGLRKYAFSAADLAIIEALEKATPSSIPFPWPRAGRPPSC